LRDQQEEKQQEVARDRARGAQSDDGFGANSDAEARRRQQQEYRQVTMRSQRVAEYNLVYFGSLRVFNT